jgi:Cu(I)/Ag(I) efflux system membrane protein CusA/SilA
MSELPPPTPAAAPPRPGPIGAIITASARNPLITILFIGGLAIWGWFSLRKAPLDAIPDLSDAQVIVFTEWMGRSPDLVEDQITYPISTALTAAPGVTAVRGLSMFGMSFVYVIFEDGTDLYWARTRVLEYLNQAQGQLPAGVSPRLGPDATGVGWVFQYALVDRTGKHDLAQLRSLQDFNLRYALQSVDGVAEVASVGGFRRQYQVTVEPAKLLGYGVTIQQVMDAIRRSNQDVGGSVMEIAGHEHVIRGRGYVQRKEDLEQVPLVVNGRGTPVLVKDVAHVALGPDIRRGIAELDGEGEVVGGIVIMRYGQNALDVIDGVKARLEQVKRSLPAGVEVVITYDRAPLIRASIATLRTTLIEEMIVVSVIIFLFLLHVRSAVVPVLTLPLGVLLAFIPMAHQGLTANIMSLGGIAVAIGAMVDASIILIENVHRKLDLWERGGRRTARLDAIIAAMQEVGPSVFFSLLVITVSFIPVFTLEGVEGRLFQPLAFTKTYSMGFAAVLSVTLTPALAAILIRGRLLHEDRHPLNRVLVAAYTPVVRFVVRYRRTVILLAAGVVALTVPAFFRLGNEFMPPLDEGAILYMPTSPPGMSDAESARVLRQMDAELKTFPEVATVFGKNGRAETATDPAPFGMVETTIVLQPRSRWRTGMTPERLMREMDQKLRYPGMPNIWWQPIQTRTEMLSTGIRSPIGIQVFGDTIAQIEEAAVAIERRLATVPGTRSAFADRSTGGYYVDVVIKREAAARFGLTAADINDVVQTAIGGMTVSETVEGRERYPINVRYPRELRDDPALLGRVLVSTMGARGGAMGGGGGASGGGISGGGMGGMGGGTGGAGEASAPPAAASLAPTHVPLAEVADIRTVTGPPMIRSEDGKLVGYVFVDTSRPLADYVAEARRIVDREVRLPPGVRVAWVGQFTYFERAKERLTLVVPITIALVFLLLYLNTRSLIETGIVLLAVPFSLVGAVWLLYLLDYNMSVAVWVGLIALAGLDAETGVVMLLYLTLAHRHAKDEGRLRTQADLTEAIVEGAARRIRPKLMTVLTTMIGLVPVLWSDGTGADVMKRIAAPMVGGLVTSFLLELTVYPAIFATWKGRGLPPGDEPTPPPTTNDDVKEPS